jgi:DNA-binding transcriptional LysR family regulator
MIESSIYLMPMKISSLYLEAFQTVCRTLNFTRAAEALHLTQSALSQRVLNLESELETTLFIRDRSGLKLTETAIELLRYCQSTAQQEEEFLSQLRSKDKKGLSGTVRIAGISSAMRSLVLPSLAPLFHSQSDLKLQIQTLETYELLDVLKRGEVDFIVNTSVTERDEFENQRLGTEENVLVAKKNYTGEEVYLDHDENDQVTFDYFQKAGKKLKKAKRLYLDDVYGLIEAAKLGLGYAVLPLHLVEGERSLEILNQSQVLKVPLFLSFYKQPYYTRLHTAIVEAMQSGFQKRLREN